VPIQEYIKSLKEEFNNFFYLKEKRENILQVSAPLYYAGGDLMDIFLPEVPERLKICLHKEKKSIQLSAEYSDFKNFLLRNS
jgi:hypothetical protein